MSTEPLAEQVRLLTERLEETERLVAVLARRAGLTAPADEPAKVHPRATGMAAVSSITRFVNEMRKHVAAGRGWDQAVDLLPDGLFQAAAREFALSSHGKRYGGVSVSGFRSHVMAKVAQQEAA